MALFRLETIADPSTGLYSAVVYYPDNAATPFVHTKPRFASHEDAAAHAVEMFKKAFPDEPVSLSSN